MMNADGVQFTLRAHRGMDLPVHGEGGSVRSYLYVTDVAQAYILVLHKGVIGDTYNIGTQKVRVHAPASTAFLVLLLGPRRIAETKCLQTHMEVSKLAPV